MQVNKFAIVIFCFLSLLIFSGCQKNTGEMPVAETTVAQTATQTEETPPYGEISDPVELEALWQEYLYDAITTVMNAGNFDSVKEINSHYVADFCFEKYIVEHGTTNLKIAGENSTKFLFPKAICLEYAKRYFDLDDVDLTDINQTEYDPAEAAFIFSYYGYTKSAHNDDNGWGLTLGKVIRTSDGALNANIISKNDNGQTDIIHTLILQERSDGSFYFIGGKCEYINNHLVKLSGDYKDLVMMPGFGKTFNPATLIMLGETNGQMILAYLPYAKDQNIELMLVDPETMTVNKKLAIKGHCLSDEVKALGDKIIIRLPDRYITLDNNLENTNENKLPDSIYQKATREPQYYDSGICKTWYGGYDVSPDGKKIAYTDESGLWLFDTADHSENLLAETVKNSDDTEDFCYHAKPRFVDSGNKVITVMAGYEDSNGYTLCDIINGQTQNFDYFSEWASANLTRYDKGILEVNQYDGVNDYRLLFLEFDTGDRIEFKIADSGDTGYFYPIEYCYLGDKYAAFVTRGSAKDEYWINRLDLATLSVEPKIVTVTAATCHILGVLSDGRIIFGYNLNPSECGLCITE